MHDRVRAGLVSAVLVLHGAACAHAPAGRADLRYVAPLPAVVSFTSIDTIESTVSGLPTGDMTTTGAISVVNELRFVPGEAGIAVTAILKKMEGSMETPMGSMPMNRAEGKPVEFTMGPTGPDPEDMMGDFKLPGPGVDPTETAASAAAIEGLMLLPGRVLALGESWTDTVHFSPDAQAMQGFAVEVTTVTRGTYAADTIVDGRTLNVLRISSEVTSKANGTIQGSQITQDMTMTSEETVLWDSERHIPVWRDAVTHTRSESVVSRMNMTMHMSGRSRSITRAETTQ